jgi:hypothetical protein
MLSCRRYDIGLPRHARDRYRKGAGGLRVSFAGTAPTPTAPPGAGSSGVADSVRLVPGLLPHVTPGGRPVRSYDVPSGSSPGSASATVVLGSQAIGRPANPVIVGPALTFGQLIRQLGLPRFPILRQDWAGRGGARGRRAIALWRHWRRADTSSRRDVRSTRYSDAMKWRSRC